MTKKNIKINMLINSLYTMLNTFFPLISAMYIARVLSTDIVGQISYSQNIVSYFVSFAPLGIPQYGIREISRTYAQKNQTDKTFSELFLINFVSTVFFSIIYVGLIFSIYRFHIQKSLYLVTGLVLFLNMFNVDWFYSGREEYQFIFYRNIIVKSICFVSLFIFVRTESDYLIYALIYSFGTAGNYILNVMHLHKSVKFQWKGLNCSRHFQSILFLALSTVANDVYTKVDTTMIGILRTDSEVAFYAYAVSITRNICVVTAAISATTLPRLSILYLEKKRDEFSKLVSQTYQGILLLVFPAMIGLFMVSDEIICVLFGEAYLPTSAVLKVLTPIVFVISTCCICGQMVLIATGNEQYQLSAMIGGSILNVILNVIMIPLWGIEGAAIASLFSEILVLMIFLRHSAKEFKLQFMSHYLSTLSFACLALIITILLIKSLSLNYTGTLILSVTLGAFSYFFILIISKNPVLYPSISRLYKKIHS